MNSKAALTRAGVVAFAIVLAACMTGRAAGDEDDPPSRVARLAYDEGSVSFQPAGTDDWVTTVLNRPFTTGDQVWSDNDGRVELQLDDSFVRLSHNTGISFLNLNDNVTQVQLSVGTLMIHVRRLESDETYEIDTPNLAFTILRPGVYRLNVDEAGDATEIAVRSGQGEVTGGGTAYTENAGEADTFSGTDQLTMDQEEYGGEDEFDAWCSNRDSLWEHSASARYVSPDVVGYEDLDLNGVWRPTPGYGAVWFPRTAQVGWAPYHYGHWAYIEPWGYTWVDDQPWGFAPFHYGRWVWASNAWGWVPAPPPAQGITYVRPMYAPALVAWVNVGGGGVAWFPLGPREVYVPPYAVSRTYINNVNVSNTTVNTTVINNYYNTTIVNKNVTVTNVTYVNQRVPGAVAATSAAAFTTAQPVARNAVRIDPRTIASAPVRAFTPAVVPQKQAVLGTGRVASSKPPAAVQSRPVVAKVAPPPPPLTFEKRQAAIRNNGGRPLSIAQVRQIQPASIQRASAVRIAPPAKGAPPKKTATNRATTNPPAQRAVTHPAAPTHASDLPPIPRSAPPRTTNAQLQSKHEQEEAQLRAEQAQERQKLEQQQQLQHQQLAQQQASQARQQQLEKEHQQQTQQLQVKHAQEQQELNEKQRKENNSQPKPAKTERSPAKKP
jgi:hypothetical protein